MKRIALLGIGHTNADFVRRWIDDPISDVELTCVSRFARSTYSGMLPGTLAGQFERPEMEIELQSLCDAADAELILDEVTGLDRSKDHLTLQLADRGSLDCHALSVGVGSVPAGGDAFAGIESFVPVKPMQTFLQRLRTRLERLDPSEDSPCPIAIVGGGVASVEIAFCLDAWLCNQDEGRMHSKRERRFPIAIYTSDHHVAGGMTERSVSTIQRLLAKRSIQVVTGQRVTDIAADAIVTGDGNRHSASVTIWATGASAPEVLSRLGLQTDDRGFLAIGRTLQTLSDPRIFAVGDCGTLIENPFPKAGVYAVRQIPVLWNNVRRLLAGESLDEFRPQTGFLKILNTGQGKALLEYSRWTHHGRAAWWLKKKIDRDFIKDFQNFESRQRFESSSA